MCSCDPDTNTDAFLTKLAPDGQTRDYSTFLGGNNAEYGLGVAVDSDGNAYITGEFSIAGRVTDSNGVGVSGVTMTLTKVDNSTRTDNHRHKRLLCLRRSGGGQLHRDANGHGYILPAAEQVGNNHQPE